MGNGTLDSSDAAHFFLRNEAGNVVASVDKTGEMETQFEYDAWGNDLSGNFTSNTESIRQFRSGKFFNQISGLYYNQARWYDPALGRFISESPIAPFAEEEYAYCSNDPVNYVDVNGLEKTLREKARDALAGPLEYLFDKTLKPILDNLIPQNRANMPPGLFPGGKECSSVSDDLGDLADVGSGVILSQLENKLPFLGIFFGLSSTVQTIHKNHIFPQQFRDTFEQAGINIDQYTIPLERSAHLKGVHGTVRRLSSSRKILP